MSFHKAKGSFLHFSEGKKYFDLSAALECGPFGYQSKAVFSLARRALAFTDKPAQRALSGRKLKFYLREFFKRNNLDPSAQVTALSPRDAFLFLQRIGGQTAGLDATDEDLFSFGERQGGENAEWEAATNRRLAFGEGRLAPNGLLILRDFWPDLTVFGKAEQFKNILLYGWRFSAVQVPAILIAVDGFKMTQGNSSWDGDPAVVKGALDRFFSNPVSRRRGLLEKKFAAFIKTLPVDSRTAGLHARIPMPLDAVQGLERREDFHGRIFYKDLSFLYQNGSAYLGLPMNTPFEHLESKFKSFRSLFRQVPTP